MATEPAQRQLGDVAMSQLEPHLETVQFRRGTCLMREGSPGDACYFIVSGEARVEVERPDFDSDGVVSYMGPGTVCGEFGLLDGSPGPRVSMRTPMSSPAACPQAHWVNCATAIHRQAC
jgi:CRP-like cAMP-binding protein